MSLYGRTDTDRALERIATALEMIANEMRAERDSESVALAMLRDKWFGESHTQAVAAALAVATDMDDLRADALLDEANEAITRRLEQVTK